MKTSILNQILAEKTANHSAVLVTYLTSGQERLFSLANERELDECGESLASEIKKAVRNDPSTIINTDDGKAFLHVFNPQLRLIIVGAVHIAQPLSQMAAMSGYEVTVIDPRKTFANEKRFPNVTVITKWPDVIIRNLNPDSRTAIVTLTHDPKVDDPALQASLKSEAFYIGALGSKKTHILRHERLERAGFDQQARQRIKGPVGLSIGAKSPAEIAVAILAQITEALRKPTNP